MRVERVLTLVHTIHEWRVARFLISGGTSAITNLSILFALTHWYGLWYVYSSVIAVSAATIVSFILQKLWTFQNFSTAVHKQFPLHVTLALLNIIVNTVLLYVLVEYFHVWYLVAQIISGVLLGFVNYFTYKTFIFRNEESGI